MGVRAVTKAMQLPEGFKLFFSHTKTGVSATVAMYDETGVDGQCQGISKKNRRCRIEALPGQLYCGHHINKGLEDVDG